MSLPLQSRERARGLVVTMLADTDPIRALEYAKELADDSWHVQTVLDTWANNDPDALRRWLETPEGGRLKHGARQAFDKHLIEHDPQAMVERIATLTNHRDKVDLSRRLADRWMEMEPEAAIQWALELPAGKIQNEVINSMMSGFGVPSVTLALPLLEKTSGSLRHRVLTRLSQSWSRRDPEAALDWFQSLSEADQRGAVNEIMEVFATETPERAATLLANLPPAVIERSERTIDRVARRLASEPQKALTWIETLPTKTSRRVAHANLASALASRDCELALAWAKESSAEARDALHQAVAQEWARTDHKAALGWIDSLPEGESTSLKQTAILSLAEANPETAAWAVSTLPRNHDQHEIAITVAETWSLTDPAAATAWAIAFPAHLRERGLGMTMGRWANEDSSGAEAFVRSLEGKARQQAIAALIAAYDMRAPAKAAPWVAEITDEEQRRGMIGSIGSSWLQEDEAKAEAWMRQSGWSDDQIKVLKQELGMIGEQGQGVSVPILDAMGNPIGSR